MLMHNKVLHDDHTLYAVHLKYEVSSNIPAFSFSAFKLGTLTDVSDKNMFTFLKHQLYVERYFHQFISILSTIPIIYIYIVIPLFSLYKVFAH